MNLIKKTIIGVAMSVSSFAHAQIPTTDIASIVQDANNFLQNMSQWQQQLQEMKNQYDAQVAQFKELERASKNFNLANLLNANNLRATVFSLNDVLNTPQYSSVRSKYPITQNSPKLNASYDQRAALEAMGDVFAKQAADRATQVEQLQQEINNTQESGAKQDLQNRLIAETNAIASNAAIFSAAKEKQRMMALEAEDAAQKEYFCREFKKTC